MQADFERLFEQPPETHTTPIRPNHDLATVRVHLEPAPRHSDKIMPTINQGTPYWAFTVAHPYRLHDSFPEPLEEDDEYNEGGVIEDEHGDRLEDDDAQQQQEQRPLQEEVKQQAAVPDTESDDEEPPVMNFDAKKNSNRAADDSRRGTKRRRASSQDGDRAPGQKRRATGLEEPADQLEDEEEELEIPDQGAPESRSASSSSRAQSMRDRRREKKRSGRQRVSKAHAGRGLVLHFDMDNEKAPIEYSAKAGEQAAEIDMLWATRDVKGYRDLRMHKETIRCVPDLVELVQTENTRRIGRLRHMDVKLMDTKALFFLPEKLHDGSLQYVYDWDHLVLEFFLPKRKLRVHVLIATCIHWFAKLQQVVILSHIKQQKSGAKKGRLPWGELRIPNLYRNAAVMVGAAPEHQAATLDPRTFVEGFVYPSEQHQAPMTEVSDP